MAETDGALARLREEFGAQWDEKAQRIKDYIAAAKIIIERLLPDESFVRLNDKCIVLREMLNLELEGFGEAERGKLDRGFDRAKDELHGRYKEAGVPMRNWLVFFLRGDERTPAHWRRRIREDRRELRELGTKEQFVERKVNGVVGDISDMERQMLRCYRESAKEDVKDITEYIKEDSARMGEKGPITVVTQENTIEVSEEGSRVVPSPRVEKMRVPPGLPTDGVVKSTPEAAEITKLIAERVGPVGQMLAGSKSGFREAHGDRVGPRMVFNSNLFTPDGCKVYYGDLLLGPLCIAVLKQISALAGCPLYVLYEMDGRFIDFVPDEKYLEGKAVLKAWRDGAWFRYRGMTGDIIVPF